MPRSSARSATETPGTSSSGVPLACCASSTRRAAPRCRGSVESEVFEVGVYSTAELHAFRRVIRWVFARSSSPSSWRRHLPAERAATVRGQVYPHLVSDWCERTCECCSCVDLLPQVPVIQALTESPSKMWVNLTRQGALGNRSLTVAARQRSGSSTATTPTSTVRGGEKPSDAISRSIGAFSASTRLVTCGRRAPSPHR